MMGKERWQIPALAIAVLLSGISHPAVAQNATNLGDPGKSPPEFHRVYVPADEIANRAWTKGFLPIDRQEFTRLLEVVQARIAGTPGAQPAVINQAAHVAQLAGDDLLVGSSELHFARNADSTSLVPLDPWSLALSGASWLDQNSKAAILGTGPAGSVAVLVEGSQLHCQWSLRGERTATGAVSFPLELPNCPMATLTLETPSKVEILSDQGIVSKAVGSTPQTIRWTIVLGGHNRLNLRIVPEESARERRPLTLLRQSLTYNFSSRGINVAAQLKLDIHGEPLQRIAVDLDPTLRLVRARYGELEVPWSVIDDAETHESHVVLQLPEPIAGTGRVLQLSALAPLTIDKPWRLPTLRPKAMAWQEGTAELLIPDSLVLEQFTTEGCRQSRTTALPAPATGESIEVQYFRPGAGVQVVLAQRREPLRVETGTLVEVASHEITSRCALEFSLTRGERFVVQADLSSGWIVDGVEALGSTRLADWELDETPDGLTRMNLRLLTGVSEGHPAKILVRGHCVFPVTPTFEAQRFQMLNLLQVKFGARLISIRAIDGSELRWSGSPEIERSGKLNLSPSELKLFVQPPTGLLFREDSTFAQASVTLQRRKANYSVDLRLDAAVLKNVVTETYSIQCTPEATARIERLLVQFSHARDVPLEWSLAGGSSGQFSARKISAAEQAQTGLPAGGEVWELSLHLARPGPFELRAVRSVAFQSETPLALASVAEAATQRGTLTIRALGDSGLIIKNRRLNTVPAELLDADRYQTVRATYHYQPSRDEFGADPAVTIVPAPASQAETGAWVWSSRLDSKQAVDGTCVHWATLRLQTAGRQQVRVSLPDDANLQTVWVDGQRYAGTPASSGERGLLIDLPAGRCFATLSLYYATTDRLPQLADSREPPFPRIDIPTLTRQWSLWLPPGYEIVDADSRYPIDAVAPLTLSQRLFGLLGRGKRTKIFNPLDARDWRQVASGGTDAQVARRASEQFAQNLGTFMADYLAGEGESELTWGQLLTLASDAEFQSRRMVLIDYESLAWLGVTPETRVRFQPGESALERGLALLKQANLVLLTQPNVIAIASTSSAAAYTRQFSGQDNGVCFQVAPGPLADELEHAQLASSWSRFKPTAIWRTAPPHTGLPWSESAFISPEIDEAKGWGMYTLYFSEQSSPRVRVVNAATLHALAWAAFLAMAAFAIWTTRRPLEIALVCSLAGALSMVLPAAYVPFASSVFLAGLLGIAWRMIRFHERVLSANERSRSTRTHLGISQPSAVLLFLAATLHTALACLAAEPTGQHSSPPVDISGAPRLPRSVAATDNGAKRSSEGEPRPTKRLEVIVPIDNEQRPAGANYLIPKELFSELYRQAAIASGQPKGLLITHALYQGTLSRDPVSKRLGLFQLKASFDLQVFQANADLAFPFPRESTSPVLAARLDGRAIPVVWNPAGDAILIKIPTNQHYGLELDLQPPPQSLTPTGFDLMIPPLANAALELILPPDIPSVEFPTARGQIQTHKDRRQLTAQLGACNRLAVRWNAASGMDTAAPNLEVEELIWVKVRPGTTVLQARFKYHVLEGRVRQIRLTADPRLRLLPPTDAQSPIAAVHTLPGDPQRIDLELSRSVSDQVVIDVSFLLTGTSGVGNLRLPRLESSGARLTRRWLAYSVDPALQPKDQAGEDSMPLAIPEFLIAWGAADSRPQATYSIPRGEPMWVLSTQPNEPHTTVDQTLAFSPGRNASRLEFDAVLTISRGYLFQLGLQGPPGLVLDSVSMLDEDAQRVSRWASDPKGQTTVFLAAPITGRQLLNVRGHVPSTFSDEVAVPQFQLSGTEIKSNRLNLFRQPSVLVALKGKPGVTTTDPLEMESKSEFGAKVGSYLLNDAGSTVAVKISPNIPQTRAVAITSLQRDADRWVAELEYHMDVNNGLVDSLQFDIPAQWSEPFRVEPPMVAKIVPVIGEARRQLVVTLPRPIAGKFDMKIRGRMALSAGDRLRVPDILPLKVEQLDRFVLLPQQMDRQPVSWETFGLTRSQLPPNLAGPAVTAQPPAVYQVSGEHFQASLKAVQRANALAQVRLADIHLLWEGDGNCQGVAAFDLESGGATNCVLQLPSGHRLLNVTVDKLPAQLADLGENGWRLALGAQGLPQRIEVIFSGAISGSASRRRFESPRLVDLDVEQTLWTVYGPPCFITGQPPAAEQRVSAAQQELYRLKNISALTQLRPEIIGEHLPEEIARWYRPWRDRFSARRSQLDWELAVGSQIGGSSEDSAEARQLDQNIAAIDARLGLTAKSMRRNATTQGSAELLAVAHADLLPSHYAIHGRSYDLTLVYPQPEANGWPTRLAIVLVMISLGASAAFVLPGRQLPIFAPSLVLGVVALGWWLFLTPSVVGPLMLLPACWAGLRGRSRVASRLRLS